ncbi:MAG: glutamyl-tRNA reductase [Chloroflexi bacterium]|nr:glutamyl-tRNA reductase [Chloroflexota bacterium]
MTSHEGRADVQASMLTMVGLSHRNAPLAIRERFAIPADELPAVREAVVDEFGAGAIVATCNRLELYVPGDHAPKALADFLAGAAAVPPSLGERYLLPRRDEEAVSHLYAVAAGIDSMVLGESEILGQVRGAFSATVAAGADNALLSRLFHTSIRLGRRARSETAIGHGALSISSIAAQQARALVPDLARASVLVIGAGEAGRLAAAALVDHGVGSIAVSNRTASRADALAEELGGRAVPYESVGAALATADVVIAATDAPEPVLNTGRVASALVRREGGPMLIVDIGVPRAAEPAVAAVPGVTYRDIDDLQEVAARHAQARADEVTRVEALIQAETASFLEWWEQLRIVPMISALTERAEYMRRTELDRTLRRLDATPEQRDQLDAMTRALVRRLLHDPIATLRQHGDREVYLDAVRELFRLDDDARPNGDGAP